MGDSGLPDTGKSAQPEAPWGDWVWIRHPVGDELEERRSGAFEAGSGPIWPLAAGASVYSVREGFEEGVGEDDMHRP